MITNKVIVSTNLTRIDNVTPFTNDFVEAKHPVKAEGCVIVVRVVFVAGLTESLECFNCQNLVDSLPVLTPANVPVASPAFSKLSTQATIYGTTWAVRAISICMY
ncbi:hypothetical protein DPMN_191291 [Dreissena polymorpha]|uniref:Uncharacterized protein n=1 Tax=Dreissena polymorpha TaxID=45954 RepID=A0A9D4BET8_DREPO|nr:hypothetical protein DPMN_191291 [Dreissena polymorpha]